MLLNLFKTKKGGVAKGTQYTKSFWNGVPKFEVVSKEFLETGTGPTIFLTSGIHGDEIAGSVILRKLFNYLKKNGLERGRVVGLVGINISGAKSLARELGETNEDLNRLFGGKVDGTFGEQLAFKIKEEILSYKPSLVIDMHNDYFFSTPYILLDPKNLFTDKLYVDTAGYALSSGLYVVQERDDERELYENALSAYMVSKNIPAITIEGGPDKLILNKHINTCFEALLNILNTQKMLVNFTSTNRKPLLSKGKFGIFGLEKKMLENGHPIVVPHSGNIKYLKEPGEYVKTGELVAKVYDEFGENAKKILATYDGYILGHSEKIQVEEGEEIYWLGKL
jgi:predicted deacylase